MPVAYTNITYHHRGGGGGGGASLRRRRRRRRRRHSNGSDRCGGDARGLPLRQTGGLLRRQIDVAHCLDP